MTKQLARWKDLSLCVKKLPEKPYIVIFKGDVITKHDTLEEAKQSAFNEIFLRYGDLVSLVPIKKPLNQ